MTNGMKKAVITGSFGLVAAVIGMLSYNAGTNKVVDNSIRTGNVGTIQGIGNNDISRDLEELKEQLDEVKEENTKLKEENEQLQKELKELKKK